MRRIITPTGSVLAMVALLVAGIIAAVALGRWDVFGALTIITVWLVWSIWLLRRGGLLR